MDEIEDVKNNKKNIILSSYTTALYKAIKEIKPKPRPDDMSVLTVSQTVSLFALIYERIRNAVEFREDHLILRAAIERILKRRLMLNPMGKGEGENLLRELLWARYFDIGTIGYEDVNKAQKIIDNYIFIRNKALVGRSTQDVEYLNQFLLDLITAEIEETLLPNITAKKALQSYFIYQVLKNKIKIEELSDQIKNIYFLVAIERTYRRSDKAYQRYHLFINLYKKIIDFKKEELETFATKLPEILKKVDQYINNLYVDNLVKYTKKQLPPFLILFEIINKKLESISEILTNKDKLWEEVDFICREKYQLISHRVRNLAVRSFIYIFLTKMIFALILEVPLSKYFYGEINSQSILINTLFPPFLMTAILAFFKIPGEENTRRIYQRIIEIIDKDMGFETKVAFVPKKSKPKRPTLIFGFTVLYTLTFIVTFSLIYEILTLLNFNLISQIIFVFFVSVVTFFSYRIKQITNELKLQERESVFTPFFDFFFMPVLSVGKFFSQEISKLNFLIFIFDFIIEAPFKLIIEVIEEWINFVKKRKEEII
ncbi:MAG: hypothetical protein ACPL1D_01895 [Microgenomates group bacterium]